MHKFEVKIKCALQAANNDQNVERGALKKC